MKYEGTCNCGKVRVGIRTEPLLKYCCHCSHCRAFASKYSEKEQHYHSAVTVFAWCAKIEGPPLEYQVSSALGGLFCMSRGRCSSCKQPIIEKGHRLIAPYAMVMTPPLMDCQPDVNLFYDSGYKKGPHIKTTIYSDLGSLLYEVWIIVTVGIPRLPGALWLLLRSDNFTSKQD